jgi:hypothetical protein
MDEFLPEGRGVHISNFPVRRLKMCREVARRTNQPVADLMKRVRRIPASVLREWSAGQSGPWEYFKARSLQGCHIAIDEIHNYAPKDAKPEFRQKWRSWLGEIRHMGATIEFLSQSQEKVQKEIVAEAGKRFELVRGDERHDPLLRIIMADWYELRAGFLSGEYTSPIYYVEFRKLLGKWRQEHATKYTLEPSYFDYYDSYSAPIKGGVKGEAEKHEFQRRSRLGLVGWFARRHFWALFSRLAIVALVSWVCFFGGSRRLMGYFMGFMGSMRTAQVQPKQEPPKGSGPLLAAGGKVGDTKVVQPIKFVSTLPAATSMPTSMPSDPNQAVAWLLEDRKRLSDKLAEVEAKLAESFGVALVSGESVTFKNGYTYAVGEKIDFGPYAGTSVKRIDWVRRSVYLANGIVLRMSR